MSRFKDLELKLDSQIFNLRLSFVDIERILVIDDIDSEIYQTLIHAKCKLDLTKKERHSTDSDFKHIEHNLHYSFATIRLTRYQIKTILENLHPDSDYLTVSRLKDGSLPKSRKVKQ